MQHYLSKYKSFLFFSLGISTLIFSLYLFSILKTLDMSLFDTFMTLKCSDKINNQIVIIEIDDKSIDKIGQWPWNRSFIAKVITNINKCSPKVIGLDILFSEKTNYDKDLIDSFNNSKKLVSAFTYNQNSILMPISELRSLSTPADVSISKDTDGIVRFAYKNSVYLPQYKSFAVSISNYYIHDIFRKIPDGKKFFINFINLSDSFKHYSFYDVYSQKFNPEEFKNKIVLIGISDKGISNYFNIPTSNKLEKPISGTELQAHIINTIINTSFIRPIGDLALFIILLLFSSLLIFLLQLKKPLTQVIITITFILFTLLSSYSLLKLLLLWVPSSMFIISSILIYSLYAFKTLLNIDKTLTSTFKKLNIDETIVFTDISNHVEKGVFNLSELTQIINKDRETIKAILDAINSPVIVIDADSNIMWKNSQVNSLPELNNCQNLSELSINFELLKSTIFTDKIFKQELVVDNKDYLLISTPINHNNSSYVCIFNDITEFKKLDQLKTDLMRTISHEIRTPLTMIQLNCDLAKEIGTIETAFKSIDSIYLKTEELNDLVTDFLDLNKLEANMIELKPVELNIIEFAGSIIQDMEELANTKNIKTFVTNKLEDQPLIYADKSRLKQVFVNLISNAIKYSDNNKTIEIAVDKVNSSIKISVIDEGFGIPEQELDKIFDKFYRVRSDQTKSISGTGLGLSIVKKIIEMHQGNIYAESKINKGTSFHILLPVKS